MKCASKSKNLLMNGFRVRSDDYSNKHPQDDSDPAKTFGRGRLLPIGRPECEDEEHKVHAYETK